MRREVSEKNAVEIDFIEDGQARNLPNESRCLYFVFFRNLFTMPLSTVGEAY